MAGRLILLRHGQTFSNVDHVIDSRPPGAELTEVGRDQARRVGAELADLCGALDGSKGRLAAFVCSVALRAEQTAMLAAEAFGDRAGLPADDRILVEVKPGIHEIFAGDFESRRDPEAHRDYSAAFHGWMHGAHEEKIAGGESLPELVARYRPVLENLVDEFLQGPVECDVVVVSHGAAIRTMTTIAGDVDPAFAFAHPVPNCRFVVLEPAGRPFGQWHVSRWADEAYPAPRQ